MQRSLSGGSQTLRRCSTKAHVAFYPPVLTMSPSTPAHYEDISPSTKDILGILGRVARYGEFEEVCNDFKRRTTQELWEIAAREGPKTSINVSDSQRSSLTTSSSMFSRDSRISTESYASSTPAAPYAGYQTQPAGHDYYKHAVSSLPQTLQDIHDSPHTNQASPYPQTARINPEKHYCLTCKKCYTDLVGLKKHQKEKCESTVYWLCLHCLQSPTQRWITFGREYRLREHHQKEHEEGAGLDMDKATRKYPPQKAWGCPCCLACFSSREEWHNHEEQHLQAVHWEGKNGDTLINGWLWTTLFESLLFNSSFLKNAASRHKWGNCDWRQGDDTLRKVKFVLERYELPPDVARYHEDSPMRTAEDIVSYAHQLLTTGKCNFQQLPSSNTQTTAISPILSNFPGANTRRRETNAHTHRDLRILTQSVGHHVPSLKECGVEVERQPDLDGNQSSICFGAMIKTSAEPVRRWPSSTTGNPLYNDGLQRDGLQVPAYPNAHSGVLAQSCHSPSSQETKKLKGKWSLRNLRSSPASSKGQVSTAPASIIPLADFQAAAATEALTPQDIFSLLNSQVYAQDALIDLPMATESLGNPYTWFDPDVKDIPHAIAVGQLPSDKLAYFDPEIGPQHGQY